MSATNACPECGTRVPADAPLGLCPRCLISASPSETAPYGGSPIEAPRSAPIPSTAAAAWPDVVRAIGELDVVLAPELDAFARDAQNDPTRLIRALVQAKKLTPYQAGALLQGKARGLLIGPYLVNDKLGTGGMGMVFKARHRPSGRVVALKILPPSFGREPDTVRRFQREFQIASRLNHPNIVAAIEASEDRGVHYLTMEYVAGYDLDRLVAQGGPMAIKLALHCVIQIARGLEAAHAQGVVHRDIKPGNTMIDAAGAVRVLDLGLARVLESAQHFGRTVAGSLTQTGSYMGTVDFLAPEQADNAKAADARSDIYSLGCTLYYLLTAKPPFPGDTILKRLIAHQDRPAPSLRAAPPEVSEALDDIYLKMMAKRPGDRPRSMSEVVLALEGCRTSSREAGDASAELKTFARTIMKRAPERRRRGLDASIFARPSAGSGDLSFDPDLRLEDLVGDYRSELGHKPLPEEKLLPIVSRPLPKRVRRRRSAVRYYLALLPIALAGLAIAAYAFWPGSATVERPPSAGTPAPAPSLASSPAPAKSLSSTSDDPNLGFRPLFTAKGLGDWIPNGSKLKEWHLENGVLSMTGHGKDNTDLLTRQRYSDFVLRLECQVSRKGNGGLILATNATNDGPSLEVDIGAATGVVFWWIERNPKIEIHWPTSPVALKPGDAWNEVEAECRGGALTVRVNGKPISYKVALNNIPGPRRIGFDAQEGTVRYRNVRIKELAAAPAAIVSGAFQSLFNGKDLSGWAGAVDDYEVYSGVLACKPGRRAVIYNPIERRDFAARVEFRLAPGSESGLLIRYPGLGDDSKASYNSMCEIQIADDLHLVYSKLDPRQYNGSAWGMAAAERGHLKPLSEWNVQEVTVRGSTVKVELNGFVILDVDLAPIRTFHDGVPHPGKDRTSGYFGLQSGPGTNQGSVEYRRIEIRDLRAASTVRAAVAPRTAGILFADDYSTPRTYWTATTPDQLAQNPKHRWGHRDGIFFNQMGEENGKSAVFLPGGPYSDFSCEIVGRINGDRSTSKGSEVIHVLHEGKGIQIRIDGTGALFIEPSLHVEETAVSTPWIGPIYHQAIKRGGTEFNTLKLQIAKRRFDIFVNSVRVCPPLLFDWDLTPAAIGLGVICQVPTVRAEYDRVEIRNLAGSTAEPRDDTLSAQPIRIALGGGKVLSDGTWIFEPRTSRSSKRPAERLIRRPTWMISQAVCGALTAISSGTGRRTAICFFSKFLSRLLETTRFSAGSPGPRTMDASSSSSTASRYWGASTSMGSIPKSSRLIFYLWEQPRSPTD